MSLSKYFAALCLLPLLAFGPGALAAPVYGTAVLRHGILIDLGSPGGRSGRADGLNNAGTVVGLSDIGGVDGFDYHVFVYGARPMTDLNTTAAPGAGWTLASAADVNDASQLLAQACNHSLSECRAVRLDLVSAVPEPGAWAMLAGGLVLLLWRARQRTMWIFAPVVVSAS